jgi:hypothetical protein
VMFPRRKGHRHSLASRLGKKIRRPGSARAVSRSTSGPQSAGNTALSSAGYGYKHASHTIFYPASPWGDLEVALAYLSQNEAYEDIAEYLATELSGCR